MPEGDTIHKIAGYLAPRLRGRIIEEARLADPMAARALTGARVEGVLARGKHLFVEFDNQTVLRSHLGMYGSWHRYAPDEAWKKPRRQASLVLRTRDDEFVCFNAKEVELLETPGVRERIARTRLGPDLIADDLDFDYLVQRAREISGEDTLLADALLDQRIAAGIGNVYKSEVLFIEGLLPALELTRVPDDRLAACYATAAMLLGSNLGGGRRVTRFEADDAGRLWVYGRDGLPCLRCDGRIRSRRLGRHHRGTYWCPRCQVTPEELLDSRPCSSP